MNQRIRIGNRWIGKKCPPFIIAEAGINHNGDIRKAEALIDAAAACSADAIKFQTHIPEKEMLKEGFSAGYIGKSFFSLLKSCELSEKDHIRLKKRAAGRKIIFLSTPFSREAADFLEKLNVPLFKTGSGELSNIPLLTHIARKGKPMIISTGMSSLSEIDRTVKAVAKYNKNIILAQCTSTYPALYKNINLGAIDVLRRRYKVPVGLSDHSFGIYTCLGAAALGAAVLEKHFTLDRKWPGPDQAASIIQAELKELVAGAKAVFAAMGPDKKVIPQEGPVRKMANESVVSIRGISPGERLSLDNTWVKRPGTGIPAGDLNKMLGKSAKKFIKADSLIKWTDIK